MLAVFMDERNAEILNLLYACSFHGREKYKDQESSASNLFECLYIKKRNGTPYVQIVIAC